MGEVEEDAGKEREEGDQILAGLGNIGPWQWRIILITGLFSAPCSTHIMIMTFMNAEVTFIVILILHHSPHCMTGG